MRPTRRWTLLLVAGAPLVVTALLQQRADAKPGKGEAKRASIARLTPGKWEIVSHMTVDASSQQMPAQGYSRCLRAEELGDAEGILRAIANKPDGESSCKPKDARFEGGRLQWEMTCPTTGFGHGMLELRATELIGLVEMQQPGPRGATIHVKLEMVGRRVGDCK